VGWLGGMGRKNHKILTSRFIGPLGGKAQQMQ